MQIVVVGGGIWPLLRAGAIGEADGVVLSVDASAVGGNGDNLPTELGSYIATGWFIVAVGGGVWSLVSHQLATYPDGGKAGNSGLGDR